MLPLSQIPHQGCGPQLSTRGPSKLGVGAGISTTPGIGKKAAHVSQQPVATEAQDVVPPVHAPERSSGLAMLKPTAAKCPAASKAEPPAAKRPVAPKAPPMAAKQSAASQTHCSVVVVESGSSASEQELEVGEGRGTAQEQAELMESNLVKSIWASGLSRRMRKESQ